MNDTLKLFTAQEDIDKGLKNSPRCCPLANCIKRTLNTQLVVVAHQVVIGQTLYRIEEVAREFIINFDIGEEVEPCEITLTKII